MNAVRRALAAGLGVMLAGLLIGGCGLRTPSGVRVDQRSVDTAADDPDIRKLPPGPAPGASPAQIVKGFLEAAAADPDHSFALGFVASGSAWTARDSATIYEPESVTPLKVTTKGDVSTIRFSARGLGSISNGGAFVPAERQLNVTYQARRVAGQWRLTAVPAGVLLTPRDLTRSYRPVRIYRFSRDGSVLVAEPGYVVSDRAGLAGAALHALLTDWGNPGGAVTGGLPPGLTALGSVVVRDGEAIVDLGREAFTVPQTRRSRVVAQIASSLASVPGVFTVQVLVEERPYAGGPVAAEIPRELAAISDGPVLAVGGLGQLLRVADSGGTRPVGWAASKLGSGAGLLQAPVSAPGGGSLAALRVTPLGDQLLIAGLSSSPDPVATLRHVKALPSTSDGRYLRPQWLDASRFLLAYGGSSPLLQLVDAVDGRLHPVYAPNLAGLGPLSDFAVSRDGTRAIAVAGPVGSRKVYLGRVSQAPGGGDQVIVDGWTQVPTALADVSAASWSADLGVMIVGKPVPTAATPAGSPDLRVQVVWLDGVVDPTLLPALPPDAIAAASGGLSLTAAPNRPVLVSAGSRTWTLRGERFVEFGAFAAPAYP